MSIHDSAPAVKQFLDELQLKAEQSSRVALLFESIADSESEDEHSEEEEKEKEKKPLTIEQLRTKKHALVTAACSAEVERIEKRMETEGAPNGYQSTSTCATMYRVFASELRRANGSFDNLLALTLAFKEDIGLYNFQDTDIPEEAQKLLTRFGRLWQDAIRVGLPLDEQSREGVMFVLQRFQKEVQEMDAEYNFTYEPSDATPKKRGRHLEAPPDSDQKQVQDGSQLRLLRSDQGQVHLGATPTPQKRPRQDEVEEKQKLNGPAGKLAEWLHRRDHELKQVQDAAVQIICREHGGQSAARAVVISGCHPLRSLGKTLAAALSLEGVIFDPHQNKGVGPAGASFTASIDGETPAQLSMSLKVVQALQGRGDTVTYQACGRTFECTLDGVVPNKAEWMFKNDTHLPRCVGADRKSLGKINKINTLFMAGRQPGHFLGCSKAEARKATVINMSVPLTIDGAPRSRSLDAPRDRDGPMTL